MKLPKIKVYFWHLVIMFIAILGAFYYIYKDMKRMETNMFGLFTRCNAFDALLKGGKPVSPTLEAPVSIESKSEHESTISAESLPELIPIDTPVEISEVKDVVHVTADIEEEFIDSDDADSVIDADVDVDADLVETVLHDSTVIESISTQVSAPIMHDRTSLLRMTNADLKEILKKKGVAVSGVMNKNKLVSLILGESD